MLTDPAQLQQALARTAETHGPGLVALVTDKGVPVFEGAVGVADVTDGRPPTVDDWFREDVERTSKVAEIHEHADSSSEILRRAFSRPIIAAT